MSGARVHLTREERTNQHDTIAEAVEVVEEEFQDRFEIEPDRVRIDREQTDTEPQVQVYEISISGDDY